MTNAVLDTEINKYLPLLGNEEKMSLLTVIRSFLNLRKESPANINIEQYNKEIDEATARMDQGHFISHEDLEKEMESW